MQNNLSLGPRVGDRGELSRGPGPIRGALSMTTSLHGRRAPHAMKLVAHTICQPVHNRAQASVESRARMTKRVLPLLRLDQGSSRGTIVPRSQEYSGDVRRTQNYESAAREARRHLTKARDPPHDNGPETVIEFRAELDGLANRRRLDLEL